MLNETYISVDVETAGPIPGQYAMLSIGACLVEDPETHFYLELQPDRSASLPEAMAISGLSLEALKETGSPPRAAMQAFAAWVQRVVPAGNRAVFVALNAPFRLDVHQRLFLPLPGPQPLRPQRAGYQGLLHGLRRRYLG